MNNKYKDIKILIQNERPNRIWFVILSSII